MALGLGFGCCDCDCVGSSACACACCSGAIPPNMQVDILDCDCADLVGTHVLPCIGNCIWQLTLSGATCGAGANQRRIRVFFDPPNACDRVYTWIINDATGDIHIFNNDAPPAICISWSGLAFDNVSGVTGDCGTAGEVEVTALP